MRTVTEAVSARGLVLTQGEQVALSASDFDIPAGRVTAVIGPNGSGKSTLLAGITGLLAPAAGTIEVLGAPPDEVRHRIAHVLQTTLINESAPLNVREVVTMGRYPGKGLVGRLTREDRDRVDRALVRMDIADLANRHLRELSGGQRQRVFVAQGLAQDHDLLLLDEPLTALDMLSAETIDAVIHEEQADGRTVVLTTHDLAEAEAADHVLLLSGRVVASGDPGTVLTRDNLQAAYGPSLIHATEGPPFLDDPAHQAAAPAHTHRDREQ